MQKLLANKSCVLAVVGLVVLLACVRAFEDSLFYDPLLAYYKTDFTSAPLPEFDLILLTASMFFRYFLNTAISLGIIYLLFKNKGLVRFTSVLYILFFVALMIGFLAVIAFAPDQKMVLFYIRRFIIQPLFLLLFIPAFYFQERTAKKNNVS